MVSSYPALAVSEVRWQPCFRVIPSRFPPIHLFERVSSPEDWEALYWLESLTNPRLRDEIKELIRLQLDDTAAATPINAQSENPTADPLSRAPLPDGAIRSQEAIYRYLANK